MIRRTLLLALALVALVAAPVAAQEYDGTNATAGVSADGETIIVNGEGFIPNSTVTFEVEFDGAIVERGTTQADAEGDVSFEVEVRGDGVHRITLTDGVNTAVVSITIGDAGRGGTTGGGAPFAGDTPAKTGGLPTTGSSGSIGLTQIGIMGLVIGGVAVYAAKRRQARAFS